ncbi:hypothetical protein BC826DRAFT_1024960 [Russula brevipes]|nr:hypothetical protein BC826DRAFT_1024960 [Russula brevipes]
MPKLEEALIDRLTLRPEVREKAHALLRTAHSKTGPGTGYDIGEAKTGLPAICAYIASKSAGYADITQEVAQKASCLAPKAFASTLKTVKTALLSSTTPNGSPSKRGNDPTAYATLIREHKIGQPLRVESWMEDAQAALIALPRFQNDFASRFTESGAEVRITVFFWVCRAIKLSTVQYMPLIEKHGVSLKVFSRLVKMMEDECIDLKESICATVREMRKKKNAKVADGAAAASQTLTTTTSTPSHSRSASPTKSALRNASLTPSLANTAAKRKVAFSLSEVSASEDDEGIFAPETPSKKRPRTTPRRAAAAAASRVLPMLSLSEDEGNDDAAEAPLPAMAAAAVAGEDAEASEDDDCLPPSRRFRPVFLDRAQWAQRAPRLARDRAAAEKRMGELVERRGHPLELLQRATAGAAAG